MLIFSFKALFPIYRYLKMRLFLKSKDIQFPDRILDLENTDNISIHAFEINSI